MMGHLFYNPMKMEKAKITKKDICSR